MFPRRSARQVRVDFGAEKRRNRVTVGLEDHDLTTRILDDTGQEHRFRVRRPIIVDFMNANQLELLEVEFGTGRGGFYVGAFVNRRCVLVRLTEEVTVLTEPLQHTVFGSDMSGKTPANFRAVEIVRYPRTLSWRERRQIHDHFSEVYGRGL